MIFQQVIHTVHKQITIGFSFSLYLEDFFRYRQMSLSDFSGQKPPDNQEMGEKR
ncbi:hypothetical protein JCM15548_11434 [Geofilum rubicundum JCM 15548]|uniref:Uncharacterized protein n=1 Tax=Geofilum rubicundum JCM 15548 TaxID=1236989 RepID=A0A0E9LVV6_9BACT|nr:hypothetical protein JCM15548_11434 [Geofilum rubicundum JCM 15548]